MSSYNDLFKQEEQKRKQQEREEIEQKQQLRLKEEEASQALATAIHRLSPEVIAILEAYGQVHLTAKDYILADEPFIEHDAQDRVKSAHWSLKVESVGDQRFMEIYVTVSIVVADNKIIGFKIHGTDGRDEATADVGALTAALAGSRPILQAPSASGAPSNLPPVAVAARPSLTSPTPSSTKPAPVLQPNQAQREPKKEKRG